MRISTISGLLRALKSRICNGFRDLIDVQKIICDVKLQKWDAPQILNLWEHPVYATCPLIPQPLLPKKGEGEKGRPIQSPSPNLGEGFRVRVTQMGCSQISSMPKFIFVTLDY